MKRNSKDFKPVILVTGCSSGIGLSLAKLLVEETQYRVVLTARFQSIKNIRDNNISESDRIMIEPLDIQSSKQISSLVQKVEERWGGIDILVNNAGISYRAVVEHMDEASELDQMTTNYLGPMDLIRSVLPFMRRKGRGKIINVSSVSGMLAMPTMSSYSASKYAMEGASEALWYEMKPLGINVSLVQPGFVNSKSFKNVAFSPMSSPKSRKRHYKDYYKSMEPFIEKMMGYSITTSDKVAAKILWTIKKQNPPLRIPASPDALAFYYLRRLVPRRIFHYLLFWLLPGSKNWAKSYSNKRVSGISARLKRGTSE